MTKKIIAIIFMISTAAIIGCSRYEKGVANRSIIVNNGTDSNVSGSINQRKALKLYNKYLPKVRATLDKYGLTTKNLNENVSDTEFVSRLVFNKDEDDIDNNIETIWYGLSYDENNLIESLNFYADCNINNLEIESDNVLIQDTLLSDIGKIFFKNTSFNKDFISAIDEFLNTETVEPIIFQYKKGSVEIVVRQNKLTMNVNLNLN